jgi:hypothetical protein
MKEAASAVSIAGTRKGRRRRRRAAHPQNL